MGRGSRSVPAACWSTLHECLHSLHPACLCHERVNSPVCLCLASCLSSLCIICIPCVSMGWSGFSQSFSLTTSTSLMSVCMLMLGASLCLTTSILLDFSTAHCLPGRLSASLLSLPLFCPSKNKMCRERRLSPTQKEHYFCYSQCNL